MYGVHPGAHTVDLEGVQNLYVICGQLGVNLWPIGSNLWPIELNLRPIGCAFVLIWEVLIRGQLDLSLWPVWIEFV